MKSAITLFIIPGLNDSGPDHWQSYWLKRFNNSKKVIQNDWDKPVLKDWLQNLNEAIELEQNSVVLVAHSLAVSLVLHWAQNHYINRVVGAMLVSASDVDSPMHTPEETRNFMPMPLQQLPFPSVVVASEDDSFVSLSRAKGFAQKWGSDFISIGKKGHINAASKLQYWEEGIEILNNLLERIEKNKQ
jgi:uncharacterized protein